jgi:hypothetical protein
VHTGEVIGYDPGGDGTHGLAILRIVDSRVIQLETDTLPTADDVIERINTIPKLLGLGIDTLTCWSTGRCGWRPADRWLRAKYPIALKSVVSPNGLYGSMGLNGMAVLIAARASHPNSQITETHPKVLYCHLAGSKYNWTNSSAKMTGSLGAWLGRAVRVSNEHEWDAALSAYAALQGIIGDWHLDLHDLPVVRGERLVKPAGEAHYYWPSACTDATSAGTLSIRI